MEAQKVYKELIWQDKDRMSGAVCFYGTRIPVSFLFDYLEHDKGIESFVDDYRVNIDVAREVVHLAGQGVENYLKPVA